VYQYKIKSVPQVVSGDTFILELDLGFRLSAQVEAALTGVKTERYGPLGQRTRDFVHEFFAPENGPFVAQAAKDRRDNYEVQIFNAAGDDLGDLLVDNSLGVRIAS
jgi:hypothetical protein